MNAGHCSAGASKRITPWGVHLSFGIGASKKTGSRFGKDLVERSGLVPPRRPHSWTRARAIVSIHHNLEIVFTLASLPIRCLCPHHREPTAEGVSALLLSPGHIPLSWPVTRVVVGWLGSLPALVGAAVPAACMVRLHSVDFDIAMRKRSGRGACRESLPSAMPSLWLRLCIGNLKSEVFLLELRASGILTLRYWQSARTHSAPSVLEAQQSPCGRRILVCWRFWAWLLPQSLDPGSRA